MAEGNGIHTTGTADIGAKAETANQSGRTDRHNLPDRHDRHDSAAGRDEPQPGLDLGALTSYLERERPGMIAGTLRAKLIAGGRSNLTYFLSDGDETWVLRRPPLGHILATAHDMAREYRVTSALSDTDVPVAKPLLLCQDPGVLGAPFYVMDRVDGQVLRDYTQAMAIGADAIPALSYRLVEVLGRLHATDPAAVGLSDFGRPEGFLERQIRRWTKQLDASRSRDVPGIDALAHRLSAALPISQRVAIVHGDYRLDNAIVGPRKDGSWDVAAVVDWEMSTLGDPLTDIGLFCVYWAATGSHSLVPIGPAADAREPFPPSRELVAKYAETSGLDMQSLPWYVAFGSFKLAVILEGIHYRHTLGKTVGEGFSGIGELVHPLVGRGLASLDEARI